MIERINPFQYGAFGHYSQGVKIDLGTKVMILVAGQLAPVSYTHLDVYKRQMVDGREAPQGQHQGYGDEDDPRPHGGVMPPAPSTNEGQRQPGQRQKGNVLAE